MLMAEEVTQHKHLTSVGTLKKEPRKRNPKREEPLFLRAGVLDKRWGGEWLCFSGEVCVLDKEAVRASIQPSPEVSHLPHCDGLLRARVSWTHSLGL